MSSQPRTLHTGDIVRLPGECQYPKGIVVSEYRRVEVVVLWPDRTHTKHHQRELHRIV